MNNNEMTDLLRGLNDESFKKALESATKQLGIDPRSTDMIIKNSQKVKKKLDGMSDSELSAALSSLDDAKLTAIRNALRGGK